MKGRRRVRPLRRGWRQCRTCDRRCAGPHAAHRMHRPGAPACSAAALSPVPGPQKVRAARGPFAEEGEGDQCHAAAALSNATPVPGVGRRLHACSKRAYPGAAPRTARGGRSHAAVAGAPLPPSRRRTSASAAAHMHGRALAALCWRACHPAGRRTRPLSLTPTTPFLAPPLLFCHVLRLACGLRGARPLREHHQEAGRPLRRTPRARRPSLGWHAAVAGRSCTCRTPLMLVLTRLVAVGPFLKHEPGRRPGHASGNRAALRRSAEQRMHAAPALPRSSATLARSEDSMRCVSAQASHGAIGRASHSNAGAESKASWRRH
jgi:hypothetical protein